MSDLIRRADVVKAISSIEMRGNPCEVEFYAQNAGFRAGIEAVLEIVRNLPAAKVVPKNEFEALLRRFRHLLQSEFIASFDKYDIKTHTYARDIAEADKGAQSTVDAVPQEEYKRVKLELAIANAYMQYMAADMENPCGYCKHLSEDGKCNQTCRKVDRSAFEWKGLRKNLVWNAEGEKSK